MSLAIPSYIRMDDSFLAKVTLFRVRVTVIKLTFRADCLHNNKTELSMSYIYRTSMAVDMTVINFSEARGRLKSVIDQVNEDADYTIIVRRDAPDAVVMSVDSFNGLMETVHLLKSPANATHLAQSIEQYRTGRLQAGNLVCEE